MALKRFTVSRRVLLLLLLAVPRHDPLCFSAQSGRLVLTSDGVSAQANGLPDPGVIYTEEVTDALNDLSKSFMLSLCLLGLLKLFCDLSRLWELELFNLTTKIIIINTGR